MAVSETAFVSTFEEQLERLDLRLFEKISSQTTDRDKRSLLACQRAVRTLSPGYTYLEIGSYLGGSLQPHLLDDQCSRIYSIDKRPPAQPDERGFNYEYRNNSTARMLANLKEINEPALAKITCIDEDAQKIDVSLINPPPQCCFIDGEHTDHAAFNDFDFCYKVLDHNGLLLFHDAHVVYHGLANIITYLTERQVRFHAYHLPDTVFAIEINDYPVHRIECIQELLIDNHVGYLSSLQYNDHYRQFSNKPIFKWLRHLKVKVTGTNVSE